MRTVVIKIGNSKGIRIPKAILEECQIENEVDLRLDHNKLVIVPFRLKPRDGWDKQFKTMSVNKEDKLILPNSLDSPAQEWEW